jgi:signal transduction histidine kinase
MHDRTLACMNKVHDIVLPTTHADPWMRLSPPTHSTRGTAEQVRALVARSPLPMLATEGDANVVQYVNPAFCRLVGLAAEALVGRPLRARARKAPQVQHAHAVASIDLVYSTGTAEFALDLGPLFGNTNAAHLPCAVWPILDDDDRPDGLLVQVSVPASEVPTRLVDNGTTDELREVNERLLVAGLKAHEQAEVQTILRGEAEAALTVRDEFISIAAHELRTPVTGIKTSAQLALRILHEAIPDNDRALRYLAGIVGGANHLVLLINDLMDVSRMRSGALLLRVTLIDLVALVSTVALRYAEATGERHHVLTDLPDAPLLVNGDAGRLEQILDNLLSNAVKYSPAGGDITVHLRHPLDGIVLTVSDAGIGLTPGAHERIFEPFGRAANATRQGLPGMGLGLHICRRIAEAHGGRMWAESDGEGQGMTVGMWLPA